MTSEIEATLKQAVVDICEERNASIIGIHGLVKQMKGKSSFVLRNNFPHLKSRLPTFGLTATLWRPDSGAPLSVTVETHTLKTLKVRIKDKHASLLKQWAFECNQVRN